MKHFISKKRAAAAALAGLAAFGGGISAYAYWTSTGSGTGTAATTAGAADTLTFNQTALAAMYPGDSSQILTVAVKNTGAQSVYVTSVKAYLTVAPVGTGTCAADDFLISNTGGLLAAAPGTAATAISLTWSPQDMITNASSNATGAIHFNNKTSNQDGCKSAAVTVNYLAS